MFCRYDSMFQLKMVIDMNDFKVSCSISLSMFNLKGELFKKKTYQKSKGNSNQRTIDHWTFYVLVHLHIYVMLYTCFVNMSCIVCF